MTKHTPGRKHRWLQIKAAPGIRTGMKRCEHCHVVRWTLYALGAGSSPVYQYRPQHWVEQNWTLRRPDCALNAGTF